VRKNYRQHQAVSLSSFLAAKLDGYFGASIVSLLSSTYFVGGIDAPNPQVLLM
jgi:hypothetical protein